MDDGSLIFFDEDYGVGGDAFLATGEAEFLGGGCLDAYIVNVDVHDLGETLLHSFDVRVELRALGTYGAVDVAYTIALGGDEVNGLAKEYLRVDAIGLSGGVGEVISYVAHVGGTEQGVADGVDEYVGIAMAE